MSNTENVNRWNIDGELDQVFSEYAALFDGRDETREQIMFAFEAQLPVLALLCARELGKDPDLTEFIDFCRKDMRNTDVTIDSARRLIKNRDRSKEDLRKDIMQELDRMNPTNLDFSDDE